MAEISVARNPDMPLWAAIPGLLAIVGLVVVLFLMGASRQDTAGQDYADPAAAAALDPVPGADRRMAGT